jgi:hypothetical protein
VIGELKLVVAPEALAEMTSAVLWWQENRPRARDLLQAELDHALKVLPQMPEMAPIVRFGGRRVHAFALRRSRYFLFFIVDRPAGEVRVTRLRSMKRRPLHKR